jgi:hypothetical protein
VSVRAARVIPPPFDRLPHCRRFSYGLSLLRQGNTDTMIDGAACSVCGIYFEKTHGHPVLCNHCWKHSKPSEREGVVRATYREL